MSEKGIWEIWPVTSPLESGTKSVGHGKRNWNEMGTHCSPYLYQPISIPFQVNLNRVGIEVVKYNFLDNLSLYGLSFVFVYR